MISFVRGMLEHKSEGNIVVEADGIGYEIKVPVSTYEKLPSTEEEVKIYTYFHVREDILELYGFYDLKEREIFKVLLSVNGVGPKLALAILSGISVDDFKIAVAKKDVLCLTKISGIGKKTAERICLELKDKVNVADINSMDIGTSYADGSLFEDVVSALVSLGYNASVVKKAIVRVENDLKQEGKDMKTMKTQDLIKIALRYLFCFLFVFGIFIHQPDFLCAEETKVIKNITIEGNKKTKDDVIFGVIRLRTGKVLDPVALQDDVKALYDLGIFSDISVDKKESGNDINLKIIVKERPMINEITYTGNKEYNIRDIEDVTTVRKDKIYSPKLLKDNIEKIKSFYKEKGFYLVGVNARADEIEKGEKVNLFFEIKEGNRMSVDKIKIKNTTLFTESKLKGEMKTNENSFWHSGIFKENEYNQDLEKIISLYNEEGYAKAKISSSNITYDEVKKKIFIEIVIEEGKQYKVGKIDIEVKDTTIHTVEEVKEKVETTIDKIFNKEKFEKDLSNIKIFYAEKGYIFARIIPEVNYNDESKTVEIKITVYEGNVSHVQDIIIEGNTKTKDYVIRREIVLKPGDAFDSNRIRRSLEKLYNLGFFDEVNYDILPGFEDGKERLLFKVKERPTANASIGAGYSTLDGLSGTVGVTENNFFGYGQRIGISAEFGGKRQNYELSFLEPWFLGYPTSVGFAIYHLTRSYYDDYKDKRLGGNIRVGQPLGNYDETNTKLWFTYKYEAVDIYDVRDTASDIIKQNAGRRDTSSLTTELVIDTRDSIFFNTKRGYRWSTSFEYAGGVLGGNINFTRYIMDASWYKLLFWELVFAAHGNAGYITGFGSTPGVPYYEMFFMGGTDTVRGYSERGIGPRDKGVAIGGRFSSHGNLEIRHPIYGPLMGVLFTDAGGVWDRTDQLNYTDVAIGSGYGLRFTITGALMLRLDFGYGFMTNWDTGGFKVHFNMGNIF